MGYPLMRRPYPYGPATRFTITGVQPPAGGYLGPADQLTVSVLSPNVDINFNIGLRFLDLTGNVQPLLTNVMAPATGATPYLLPIQVAEGFLLSATAFGSTVNRGQCWVQLLAVRQKAADAQVVGDVLLQGYVCATDIVTWPGTPAGSSLDGRGWLRQVNIPAPAAATPVTIVVPPGVRWRFQALYSLITNSAVSGFALMQIQDSTGAPLLSSLTTTVVTPNPYDLSFYANGFFYSGVGTGPPAPNYQGASVGPDIFLTAGQQIVLMQDPASMPSAQFDVTRLVVEEWVEI